MYIIDGMMYLLAWIRAKRMLVYLHGHMLWPCMYRCSDSIKMFLVVHQQIQLLSLSNPCARGWRGPYAYPVGLTERRGPNLDVSAQTDTVSVSAHIGCIYQYSQTNIFLCEVLHIHCCRMTLMAHGNRTRWSRVKQVLCYLYFLFSYNQWVLVSWEVGKKILRSRMGVCGHLRPRQYQTIFVKVNRPFNHCNKLTIIRGLSQYQPRTHTHGALSPRAAMF